MTTRNRTSSDTIVRAVLIAFGVGLGIVGLINLIGTLSRTVDWISFAEFFLLPPILSDALIMPAVAVVGWLILRLPHPARGPAVVGLVISLALLAVGGPFLGRPGLRADNPTLLNRDYPTGVAIYLAILWIGMLGWWLVRRRRVQAPVAVG